jgi:hypothetical protein
MVKHNEKKSLCQMGFYKDQIAKPGQVFRLKHATISVWIDLPG